VSYHQFVNDSNAHMVLRLAAAASCGSRDVTWNDVHIASVIDLGLLNFSSIDSERLQGQGRRRLLRAANEESDPYQPHIIEGSRADSMDLTGVGVSLFVLPCINIVYKLLIPIPEKNRRGRAKATDATAVELFSSTSKALSSAVDSGLFTAYMREQAVSRHASDMVTAATFKHAVIDQSFSISYMAPWPTSRPTRPSDALNRNFWTANVVTTIVPIIVAGVVVLLGICAFIRYRYRNGKDGQLHLDRLKTSRAGPSGEVDEDLYGLYDSYYDLHTHAMRQHPTSGEKACVLLILIVCLGLSAASMYVFSESARESAVTSTAPSPTRRLMQQIRPSVSIKGSQ
jgi:hypothetical protein